MFDLNISFPSRHFIKGISQHYEGILKALILDIDETKTNEVLDHCIRNTNEGTVDLIVHDSTQDALYYLEKYLKENKIPFDSECSGDLDNPPISSYYRPMKTMTKLYVCNYRLMVLSIYN
jgi:hypothetical protein